MTKIPRNDWKQRSEVKSGHISYITLISWRLEIKRRRIFFTFDWIIRFWLYVCFLRSVNVAPPTTPETTTRVSVSQLAGRDPKMAAGSSDGSQFRWTLGFVPSRWTLGRDAAEKHWAERTDRRQDVVWLCWWTVGTNASSRVSSSSAPVQITRLLFWWEWQGFYFGLFLSFFLQKNNKCFAVNFV